MKRPTKSSEFDLIHRFFAPLASGEPGAFALRDDAAVLTIEAGLRLVVTTDTMVSGVHFLANDPPALIATKLLRVNLSDLAAMGAAPFAFTLNMALPTEIDDIWLADFATGLGGDQMRFGVSLVGGDTVAIPGPLTLTLTAFGKVEEGGELRRASARPGDDIYVSGTIGDAALGLLVLTGALNGLSETEAAQLTRRYHKPEPRIALGRGLVGLAHAACDISDGLAADLGHICEASGLGAIVDTTKVPLSPAARAALAIDGGLLATVLGGGDDFELVFSAPAENAPKITAMATDLGISVSAIGTIVSATGVKIKNAEGNTVELQQPGFRHF
jgi:thiamine-monophosphate kinase